MTSFQSIIWQLQPPYTYGHLGLLPRFVLPNDPRPAAEQISERYSSGWDSFKGLSYDPITRALSYPGDPDLFPIASALLHNTPEIVLLYPFDWVVVYNTARQDFDAARIL